MSLNPMADEGRVPRLHTEALPRSMEELVARFKQILQLSDVEEIRVTPKELSVRRLVSPGEPVLPTPEDDLRPDLDFILSRIELLELPLDPHRHPYLSVEEATRLITSRGMQPKYVLGPEGPWVAAYLNLPEEPPLTHVFGMRILTTESPNFSEKLVVVGCNGSYLTDAVCGVVLDLGA